MTHISVILPVYNGERYIGAALDSLFAQTHPADEILVIDDASTDATAAVVAQYEVCHIVRAERSLAGALNEGIARASGELIAFMAADDVAHPQRLERQAGVLQDHPQTAYTYTRVTYFMSPELPPNAYYQRRAGTAHIGLIFETLMIRRSAFAVIGGFNHQYAVTTAADWLMRADSAGLTGELVDEVLYEKRVHDQNTSRTAQTNREYLKLIYHKLRREKPREMP
jgi:glycosyltransferase involved in cell wall biosynthesis